MKLTDEERNSLVILQLEKAKVFLKQADEMFDLKYWDIASNMTKAIFAFLNLGSFNLFSASSLSENRETALVTHSSIPNPLKTLSGCIFLCEKKSSVVTGLPFAIL